MCALSACVGFLLAVLPACDAGRAEPGLACRFGREHPVARVRAAESDGLALLEVQDGLISLWSEPNGLMGRGLARDARGRGPVRRLGPRCRGGIAAAVAERELLVACLDTPAASGGPEQRPFGAPSLRLVRVGWDLRVRGVRLLAEVGARSRGVAMVLDDPKGPTGFLAWHDASAADEAVFLLRLTGEADGGAFAAAGPRRLSPPGRAAGHPALLFAAGALRIAWAETFLEQGEPRAALQVAGLQGAPVTVASVHHDAVRPVWANLGEGRLALAFRDRRRRDARTGLYLLPLSATGDATAGPPLRIARADGAAQPALSVCTSGLVSATPRTYAGDHFVGLNVLTAGLSRRAPEQQFYQDAHEFSQAAVACAGGQAALLIGERARVATDDIALWAVPVVCDR